MRRDEARPSLLQRLFAERHIYLRSGPGSRYVIVSSALQAGVAIAFILALALLGGALYTSVDKHLEAAERSRELARLEGVNKSLLAAADATRGGDEARDADDRIPELIARLDEAEAARGRAAELAEAASAERDELRRELDLARTRIDEAVGQLAAVQAERDALMAQVNTQVAPAGGERAEDPQSALTAEVADLTAERAALQAELDQARAAAEQSITKLQTAEEELASLRERLEETSATRSDAIERLEVRIATLQAENEQLSQAVDEIQGERHELQTRLQEAEADAGPDAERADPAEVGRLRAALAEAEGRLADMEQAQLQAEPSAGPDDPGAGEAGTAQLEEELAAARQRIAQLERDAGATRGANLQRRPAVGEAAFRSEFPSSEDGGPAVEPALGYQSAAEAVLALRAQLAAADELVGIVAGRDADQASGSIDDLRLQIESAGERIQTLNATLDQLKQRDVALQRALATLAPLPPPPAPRRR